MDLKNKILSIKDNIFAISCSNLSLLNQDFCYRCPVAKAKEEQVINLTLLAGWNFFIFEQHEIVKCNVCRKDYNEANYIALKVASNNYCGYIALTKFSIEKKAIIR